MSRPGLTRAIALLLFGGVVLVAFLLAVLPQQEPGRERSVGDAEAGGRLGAFMLLRELGFEPRAWRAAPGELPRGRTVLFLPAKPEDPPDYLREAWADMDASEGQEGEAPHSAARRRRDPRHYRRFLEEGGVIVAALDEGRAEFFKEELDLDVAADLAVEERDTEVSAATRAAQAAQAVVTRGGETLTLDWSAVLDRAGWLKLPRGVGSTVFADAGPLQRPFVASLPVGRGELVVLANDGFLDNRALDAGDNALAMVRLVEDLAPFDALCFDEYALGGYLPDTPLDLALRPSTLPLLAHLVLAVLLGVWWAASPGPFPRDPEPLGQASPRARARAQGALLARLGAWDALARALRRGVLAELPGATDRRGLDAGDEEALALALARAPLSAEERASFEAALAPGAVRSAEQLARLSTELARLERLSRERSRPHNPPAERDQPIHGR